MRLLPVKPIGPLKQLRNYQLFYRVVNQCNRALKKGRANERRGFR